MAKKKAQPEAAPTSDLAFAHLDRVYSPQELEQQVGHLAAAHGAQEAKDEPLTIEGEQQ
jgi:hypothetical protein